MRTMRLGWPERMNTIDMLLGLGHMDAYFVFLGTDASENTSPI